jgi:hypothetical protein
MEAIYSAGKEIRVIGIPKRNAIYSIRFVKVIPDPVSVTSEFIRIWAGFTGNPTIVYGRIMPIRITLGGSRI